MSKIYVFHTLEESNLSKVIKQITEALTHYKCVSVHYFHAVFLRK